MNGRHAWTGGWWNRLIRGGAASAMRPHASTPSAPGRTVAGWDRGAAPGSGADGLPGGLQESGVRTRSTAGRRELRLPARRPARLVRSRTPEDVRRTDGRVAGRDRSVSRSARGWPPTRWAEWLVLRVPPPGRCRGLYRTKAGRYPSVLHAIQLTIKDLGNRQSASGSARWAAPPRPTRCAALSAADPVGGMAGFESSPLCLN